MIISKLAFRNIFRQRRRTALTILTMVGGFTLLSIAMSLSEGTYSNVIKLFTRSYTGHVQIHKDNYLDEPSLYKTFDRIDSLASKIGKAEGILSWAPRVYSPALAFIGKKTTVARLIGIDPRMEINTTGIDSKIEKGSFFSKTDVKEVLIGGGLAKILNAKIGDEMVLIAQSADGSIANDIFKIAAILKGGTGSAERLNCYMPIATAQEFLFLKNRYHEISVIFDDYHKSIEGSKELISLISDPSLDIQPWERIQKQFYSAMMADKKGMWIGLSIIITIVAIGVLNTVLMSILERTREFGVLKALGTQPSKIFSMIIIESLFLASFSVIFGFILSCLINYFLSIHGIDYPQSVEMGGFVISTMYGSTIPKVFLYPTAVTMSAAFLVSIFPALRAARISPMKAIRTD